jgi:hypothetical protein
LALLLGTVTSAFGQLVQVGPPDQGYCDKVEHVNPNLVLSQATHLSGRIVDQTGAPFVNSVVELRLYKSQTQGTSVRKVRTDEDGRFDLSSVARGSYRLLASPTRTFRQPEQLDCYERDPCALQIRLEANPTDQPDMFCPVK